MHPNGVSTKKVNEGLSAPEVQKAGFAKKGLVFTRHTFCFIIMKLFAQHFSPRMLWGSDLLKICIMNRDLK